MGNDASTQFGKKIENDMKVSWKKEMVCCPFAPREGQAVAVVGSIMYLFGGVLLVSNEDEDVITETNELLVYDSDKKTWSKEIANTGGPSERSGSTMTAIGQNLYVFGGLSQMSGWMNDLFMYDINSKVWKEIDVIDGPSPRDKVMSVSLDSKIYIFGGFGPALDTDQNEEDIPVLPGDEDDDEYEDMDELYDVRNCQEAANFTWSNQLFVFDTINDQWSLINVVSEKSPSPRAAHTLSVVTSKNGKSFLYVFGGRDCQSRKNDLWKFNIDENIWEECNFSGCPPPPRSFHATVAVRDRLAVYGGRGIKDQHFNDFHVFDTNTNEWLQPKPAEDHATIAPPAIGLHSLCVAADQLILFGGSNDLDPATGTCIQVFNDVYTMPTSQLLQGGSIRKQNAESTEGEKQHMPHLLNLKQNTQQSETGDA